MWKAIIATLVLGVSAVAVADSGSGFRTEARRGHSDTMSESERRYIRDRAWIALTSPFELDRGRAVIDVRQRTRFQKLRLQQTTHGMTFVDRIIVRFENGERQVIEVNQHLSTRNPMMNLDLEGHQRRVDRIIVMGDSRRGGAIQVFGI